MRVLVCGGRSYSSAAYLFRTMDAIHAEEPITAIIQGGAEGADRLAQEWARTKPEIDRFVSKADWEKHGRKAGPLRNARMLEWKPDLVIAFPGGIGTTDMVRQAKEKGYPVLTIKEDTPFPVPELISFLRRIPSCAKGQPTP